MTQNITQNLAQERKLGAPQKVPGGLREVLFVRTNRELLSGLDKLVECERQAHPGRTITRADIVRDILYQAIRKKEVL